MKISIPPQVKSTFDRFRQTGSLGPQAEKAGPEMGLLLFTSLRATMEDVAQLDSLDNVAGKDADPDTGHIQLTPQAIADMGKPYQQLRAESYENTESVVVHKSAGDRQSFELITQESGAPAVVTATLEGNGSWNFGSNTLRMENGQPVVDEHGIPVCVGEMLIAGA